MRYEDMNPYIMFNSKWREKEGEGKDNISNHYDFNDVFLGIQLWFNTGNYVLLSTEDKMYTKRRNYRWLL